MERQIVRDVSKNRILQDNKTLKEIIIDIKTAGLNVSTNTVTFIKQVFELVAKWKFLCLKLNKWKNKLMLEAI